MSRHTDIINAVYEQCLRKKIEVIHYPEKHQYHIHIANTRIKVVVGHDMIQVYEDNDYMAYRINNPLYMLLSHIRINLGIVGRFLSFVQKEDKRDWYVNPTTLKIKQIKFLDRIKKL